MKCVAVFSSVYLFICLFIYFLKKPAEKSSQKEFVYIVVLEECFNVKI